MIGRYTGVMAVTLVLLFAACATVPKDIKVESEVAPRADLSGYKTYAWLGTASILYDPDGRWEPPQFDADAEIMWLIDRELRKRGITKVTESPDMVVGFAAGVDMSALELKENPETKMILVENVPKGALAVVFIDTVTGFPVWVAVATGDIQKEPSTETVKMRLDYAVSEMFKQLPQ